MYFAQGHVTNEAARPVAGPTAVIGIALLLLATAVVNYLVESRLRRGPVRFGTFVGLAIAVPISLVLTVLAVVRLASGR